MMELFPKRSSSTSHPAESDPQRSEIEETFATLDAAWKRNPVEVIAHFVRNTRDPLHTVAFLLVSLAADGVLTPDNLAALGIQQDEMHRVVSILRSEQPGTLLRYESSVREAVREHEAAIDELIEAAGATLDPAQRAEFLTKVAQFAYDNELTDLKIAYRLMCAEIGDPLKGLGKRAQQGYI